MAGCVTRWGVNVPLLGPALRALTIAEDPKLDGTRMAQACRGGRSDRPLGEVTNARGEYKIRPYQRGRAVSYCYTFRFSRGVPPL